MTGVKLPDGVPYDNTKRSMSAGGAPFSAPDTATPAFAGNAPATAASAPADGKSQPVLKRVFRVGGYVEKDADNRDDDEGVRLAHAPHLPAPVLILVAIALVLAALAAYVVSRNNDPAPVCADQPEWNQYNCRTN